MSKQFTLDLPLSPDAEFSTYVGQAGARLQNLGYWNLVWGAPGSGRTHLLQAICRHEQASTRPEPRSDRIYLSQLRQLAPEVLQNLESFSVVCIDDVDQILGDKNWEEALFHLLNGAKDRNKSIVMSVPKSVQSLSVTLPDLQSRIKAAASIQTDVLTDDQKVDVLQKRARHWGFELPREVGQFILSRSPRSMVSLIDNLKRLELETLRAQRKVTIPFAKQTLQL